MGPSRTVSLGVGVGGNRGMREVYSDNEEL